MAVKRDLPAILTDRLTAFRSGNISRKTAGGEMELTWERLKVFREKRSIGGWILFGLGVGWNAIGHWQNFVWLENHLPGVKVHGDSVSIFLILAGLAWFTAVLLWPVRSGHPWLQFEKEGLQIQNTDGRPIFDVRVKIGEKAVLESDIIPRIEGKSWVLCKKRDQVISRNQVSEKVVEDILSEGPSGTTPALVIYRRANGDAATYRLDLKSQGSGLQFFLPTNKK